MSVDKELPEISLSQGFSRWASNLRVEDVPEAVRQAAASALLDFAGLCVSARDEDYVHAMIAAAGEPGACTAIGHAGSFDAGSAALVGGTAAHGEDYDDTFEGTPVHTGAVILPAILAAGERFGFSGADALRGIAAGTELMCRMALVAPMAVHRAGFYPTAVIGALGAATAVGTALRLSPQQLTDAIGIAGSFASGIIEYLAEGSWTKRAHPGWAAQSGLRAALLRREGFAGPRTVQHGFFFAFADPSITPDYTRLIDGLGAHWQAANIAFKPYACGTMAQPFIDCAIRLAKDGVKPADIAAITCKAGEGTVHRLWEKLAEKRAPTTPYSAEFSQVQCALLYRRRPDRQRRKFGPVHRGPHPRSEDSRPGREGELRNRSAERIPGELFRAYSRNIDRWRRPRSRATPSSGRRPGASVAHGAGNKIPGEHRIRRLDE